MKGIQYLTRKQVDPDQWDNCIRIASNGLIYAHSFYLDAMSREWDALVLNDYEAVMPLTWNRKYGLSYLYQPPFTASLGLFGANINADLLEQFLKSIPNKFKYWDISLNHGNYFQLDGFELQSRSNYVLNLEDSYEDIAGKYRENVSRNIKKSVQLNDTIKKEILPDEIISLAKQQLRAVMKLENDDFKRFKNLYEALNKREMARTYGVYAASGQLLASAVFFLSNNRAYYILVGNHPNSKATGASHRLIDAFIGDHAGQKILLDFEGSDIRNLAFFYSSFGAVEEKYSSIKLNRLPAIIKWFKK